MFQNPLSGFEEAWDQLPSQRVLAFSEMSLSCSLGVVTATILKANCSQGHIVLTWSNFNASMDK